jgi:hypothetical protein
MAGWQAGLPTGTGKGRGIGFAQYKNMAAYAAVVAEVEVDETVRVLRVWCAADAGLVINPDGAINQLEGGIVQGTSWALKEGVRLDENGISSRDWEGYPVLRFSEVPDIAVELIDPSTDRPPLGVGEASGGLTVARSAPSRDRRPHPRPAPDPRARHGHAAANYPSNRVHEERPHPTLAPGGDCSLSLELTALSGTGAG